MMIVRISDGVIVEQRDMPIDNVPAHKRAGWRIVEDRKPDYHPGIERLIGPTFVIDDARAVRAWTVERRSIDEQRATVKGEARRRILERFPEWKQANMTARGVELQDAWRRFGKWTEDEQAEADALAMCWAWIKAVRAASDAIESLDPIPRDFAADERWPA